MSIAQNVVTGIGLADGFADTYGELGDLAPRVVIDALGADGDVALGDLYERWGVSEIVDELSPAAIVVILSIAVALESADLMTPYGSPGGTGGNGSEDLAARARRCRRRDVLPRMSSFLAMTMRWIWFVPS